MKPKNKCRKRTIVFFPGLRDFGINHSRTYLKRKEREGAFPNRIKLPGNRVGWFADELKRWARRRKAA